MTITIIQGLWKEGNKDFLFYCEGVLWPQGVKIFKLRFKPWGLPPPNIYIFKWLLLLKIQIIFKNQSWKEKSDEDMVTWGPMAQATLKILTIIRMTQRNNIMLYYSVKVYIV
jgi:hypothetical protein